MSNFTDKTLTCRDCGTSFVFSASEQDFFAEKGFTDKTLTCRDCGTSFVFSASEQEFFAEKGFTNEPGRCPECRAASKARRNGGFAYSTGGGGGSYDRPQRQMYPAVCATCGKATQVPFEPRLDRPVYCSDCYTPRQSSGGSSYGRRPGGNSGGGRRSY